MVYILKVDPHTKPRMTQRDVWEKRSCVVQYRQFKDDLREECKKIGLTHLEPVLKMLTFIVPMPKSWSKKKKLEMDGQPHQQTPDLDNLEKGFWDAMLTEDNYIWKVENASKVWGREGRIILEQALM